MPTYSPTLIGFELVRGCNFQCRMCPVPEFMPNKAFTFMSDEVIDWTIEQVKSIPTVHHVYLFNFGEPMAHPRFVSIIEKMERELLPVKQTRGLTVEMFTNGSLLTGAKAEVLLRTQILSSLVLSFDGYGDKESFEAMRGPWFDKVLKNVREFAPQAAARRPDMTLQTNSVVPREEELHLGRSKDLATAQADLSEVFNPLGFSVNVKPLHNYAGDVEFALKADNAWIVPKGSCHNVEADQVFVSGNGKIMPCCSQMDEGLAVGSWDSGKTLTEIYNDKPMNKLRHLLRTDRRQDIEQCKSCQNSIDGAGCSKATSFQFWNARHAKYPITNPLERAAIFGDYDPDQGLEPQAEAMAERSAAVSAASRVLPEAEPAAAGSRVVGFLDAVMDAGDELVVIGWAANGDDGRPAERMVMWTPDGPVAPTRVAVTPRAALVELLGHPKMLYAGFEAYFPKTARDPFRVLAQVGGEWGELANFPGLTLAPQAASAVPAAEPEMAIA